MRTIVLSVVAVLSTAAYAAACSAPPTVPSSSSATPTGSVPALSVATQSLTLVNSGSGLRLDRAPANPAYDVSYPMSDLSAMTVTVNAYGDLTAGCESGGAVACSTLPFFAHNSDGSVKVYDAYGKIVMLLPACNGGYGGFGGHHGGGNNDSDASEDASDDASDDSSVVNGTTGINNGTGSTGDVDAASCDPQVSASFAGCALTIDGTLCNCSDAVCAGNAIEACLGSLGVVSSGNNVNNGNSDDASDNDSGLVSDDAGFVASEDAGEDAGAGFNPLCSSATLASAQAQFCADVNAALAAQGSTATIDCSALSTLTFPSTTPTPPSTLAKCDQLVHQAIVQVRAELATCNPLDYVGWSSSAKLQLFKAGACTVW